MCDSWARRTDPRCGREDQNRDRVDLLICAARKGRRPMAGRLAGKVAIVTGAGSKTDANGHDHGNGRAAAILFAREGARVLCADRHADRAERTAAIIRGEGGDASVFEGDVSRRPACRDIVAAAVERYGRLDVLHNNVGINSYQKLEDITDEAWDEVMAVNVRSVMLMSQAAVPHLD